MMESNFEKYMDGEGHISKTTGDLLLSIAKWTKFLSIFGFVVVGIMIIILLFSGILISSMNYYADVTAMYPYMPGKFSWGFFIMYLIIAAVYFIPLLMLYKFSVNAKKSVETNNQRFFEQSLRFLSNHYKIIGILTIILTVFFVVSIVGMFIGMSSMMI